MRRKTKALLLAVLPVAAIGVGLRAESLTVVATTTIVADVVASIAGDRVRLDVLLPVDADPHGYQPTPRDVVAVSEADLVFLSGAGLEEEFADLLESASGRLVDLSARVALRRLEADDGVDLDPHVWFDPTNVMIWTDAVEEALVGLDPDGASVYAANAVAAREALVALDHWIWAEVSRIPRAARTLVTDHRVLGYFAARYGFDQVGTVFPGASTLAEPSARDLAALVDAVRALGVPAIFVGTTVSPTLAEAIAADAGAEIVRLYTGSLSDGSGPAGSYVDMMRFNVDAIVGALASRE